MTTKEKVEYLQGYRDTAHRMLALTQELEWWETDATRVTAILSDMPGGGSGGDRLQRAVEEIVEIEDWLQEALEQCIRQRREIERAVAGVEDQRLQTILRLKYINGKALCQIAETMFLEYRWVKRLHGQAIKQLEIPGA